MYDPYIATSIASGQAAAPSYWQAQATPMTTARLTGDTQAEIVVVGAGYTGLSCAYQLAKHYQREVLLLDANSPAWGCSGRNAGFVLRGTGRLGMAQLTNRFGLALAKAFFKEYSAALDRVSELTAAGNIDCQAQPPNYLKIAHSPKQAALLAEQVSWLQQHFGYQVQYIEQTALTEGFVNSPLAYGAMAFPDCYGVNPLALAQGYAQLAKTAGVTIVGNTAVTKWQKNSTGWQLSTNQGRIACQQLVFASNAYTPKQLLPEVNRGCLPVLSSIIVTEPLSPQQLAASGLAKGLIAMDTRALKYYYRLLPDNRILFGGRSAIKGEDIKNKRYPAQLLRALKHTLPQVEGLSVAYHWAGWVGVSYDDLPRVGQTAEGIYYAAGYCGSGVAYSALAGQRLAERVMGLPLPALPLYHSPLQAFPFTAGRRLGQYAYYQWAELRDRWFS